MRYLWSSVLGEAVLEHDVNLGAYRQYVYTPGGALIALRSYDSQFYWVHEDHLGSGRRLTDQAGTLIHEMELDPHGTIVRESPANNYLNSHKFTGYERDWSTETDNAKARTYDSRIARFLQPDPLGVAAADITGPQSLNRYSYVENDPVNNVDPLGLMTCFGYHAYSVLVDSETGAVIGETYLGFMPQYCWDEQTGGTVGGGGGGAQAKPSTPLGTAEKYIKLLEKALAELQKRLLRDECAKFFGGSEAAMTTISNTEYRFVPLGAPAVNPANGTLGVKGAATMGPNSVFVNTQGPFISQNIFVPGEGLKSFGYETGLSGAQFNAMLLLHELGHQLGLFGPDASDPKLNAKYTEQVLKACF